MCISTHDANFYAAECKKKKTMYDMNEKISYTCDLHVFRSSFPTFKMIT